MRKLIAAAALVAVTSAHTAEELKFGDINYFFKQGQLNAALDIDSRSYAFDDGSKVEVEGKFIQSRLTYGLSDKLNLFLGLDYSWDMKTATTGTKSYYQDGLSNPALGATYRLMNQNDSAYNIDFGAVARFGLVDEEMGSPNEDGNAADGRNSLELNARMGRKWNEANEWQLSGGVVHHFDGESERNNAGADSEFDDDGSNDMFLRAAYQYRPVNEFMIELSVLATRVGETDSEETTTNTKIENDSHIDYDFGFIAKYLITSNFIAKFRYAQGNNPDYDVTTGGVKSEVERRYESHIGLGVDFLF